MRRLNLREVTEEEEKELRRLANSRKEERRLVQRAQLLVNMLENPSMSASQACLQAGFKSTLSTSWVHRFNEDGLNGIRDKKRAGRPATHTEDVRSALISLALQKPRSLGYPFELWTLQRLQRSFRERKQLHLSKSTIWEWLKNEGLEWKRQQSWFHDAQRHDPDFEEKRGS